MYCVGLVLVMTPHQTRDYILLMSWCYSSVPEDGVCGVVVDTLVLSALE